MNHDKDSAPAFHAGWPVSRPDHHHQQQQHTAPQQYVRPLVGPPQHSHLLQQEYGRTQLAPVSSRPHDFSRQQQHYFSSRDSDSTVEYSHHPASSKRKSFPEGDLAESSSSKKAPSESDGGVEGRKPKRKRAQQACLRCRTQKLRCDGMHPCGRCSALGRSTECAFELPPGPQLSSLKSHDIGVSSSTLQTTSRSSTSTDLPYSTPSPAEAYPSTRREVESTHNLASASVHPSLNSNNRRYLAAPPTASFPVPHPRHHAMSHYPASSISAPPTSSTRTTATYPIEGGSLIYEREASIGTLIRPASSSGPPPSPSFLLGTSSGTDRHSLPTPASTRPTLSPPSILATSSFALDVSSRLSRLENLLERVFTALSSRGGIGASPPESPLDALRTPMRAESAHLRRSMEDPPRLRHLEGGLVENHRHAVTGSHSMPELYSSSGSSIIQSDSEIPFTSGNATQTAGSHDHSAKSHAVPANIARSRADGQQADYRRRGELTRSVTPDCAEEGSCRSTNSNTSKLPGGLGFINGMPAYGDSEEASNGPRGTEESETGDQGAARHRRTPTSDVHEVAFDFQTSGRPGHHRTTQDGMGAKASLDPVASGIISPQRAQQLIEVFQSHFLPFMPIMDAVNPEQHMQMLQRREPFLLIVILAVASLYKTRTPAEPPSSSRPQVVPRLSEEFDRFVDLIEIHLGQFLCRTNHTVGDIQAVVFLGAWGLPREGSGLDPWILIGLAIRAAKRLNISNVAFASEQPSPSLSSSHRTWLMLGVLDCFPGYGPRQGLSKLGPGQREPVAGKEQEILVDIRDEQLADSERACLNHSDAFVAAQSDLALISRSLLEASANAQKMRTSENTLPDSTWRPLVNALDEWLAHWLAATVIRDRQQSRIALLHHAHIRLSLAVLMLGHSERASTDVEMGARSEAGSKTEGTAAGPTFGAVTLALTRSSALHAAWLIVRLHLGTSSADEPLAYAPKYLVKSLAQAAVSFCRLSGQVWAECDTMMDTSARKETFAEFAAMEDPLSLKKNVEPSDPARSLPPASSLVRDALQAMDSLQSPGDDFAALLRSKVVGAQTQLDGGKLVASEAVGGSHNTTAPEATAGRTGGGVDDANQPSLGWDDTDLTSLLFGSET